MNRESTQNIVKHKIWIFDNWVSEVSMSDRNTNKNKEIGFKLDTFLINRM